MEMLRCCEDESENEGLIDNSDVWPDMRSNLVPSPVTKLPVERVYMEPWGEEDHHFQRTTHHFGAMLRSPFATRNGKRTVQLTLVTRHTASTYPTGLTRNLLVTLEIESLGYT